MRPLPREKKKYQIVDIIGNWTLKVLESVAERRLLSESMDVISTDENTK